MDPHTKFFPEDLTLHPAILRHPQAIATLSTPRIPYKMKFRHIPRFRIFKITRRGIMLTFSESATIALQVLKALDTASAAFPPMQAATSAAVSLAEIVKDYSSHKEEWANFCTHIAATLRFVQEKISSASESEARRLVDTLLNLSKVVQEIENQVKKYNKRGVISKFWLFLKDPEYISGLEKELNDAVDSFHFDNSVSVAEDVARIRRLLENGKIDDLLKRIDNTATTIVTAMKFSAFPVAPASAWIPRKGCLPHTRTAILDDIRSWIYTPSKTAEIYFLADVAGSGKSAIAHSIGVWCSEQKILASSFFFNRDEAARNHCQDVILQVARDLASRSPTIASLQDLDSVRHGLFVQFEKLVIEPTQRSPLTGPQVLIFDALDEANDNMEFLQILRNDVPKLPSNFRIFVTSRNDYEIMNPFNPSPPHVSIHSIEIHGKANKDDITIVIQDRLERVRAARDLPQNWPSASELHQLQVKAEGLMIWATTICDYLASPRDAPRPRKELSRFLSAHSPAGLDPVAKMEVLYAAILAKGNWTKDAVQLHQSVIGAVIAAKRPLSTRAMQSLLAYDADFDPDHDGLDVETVLRSSPVRTLLTGCEDRSRPVQVLHLSFRDFITSQYHSTSPTFINEKKHSQRLAYCCIELMNEHLRRRAARGMDYLVDDVMHEPIPEIAIPDEVLYACQFWLSHLDDVDDIESDSCLPLRDALGRFLSTCAVTWLETLTANGKYRPLLTPNVRKCLRLFTPHATLDLHPQYPQASYRLVKRLDFFNRVDEAYPCSAETVELFRHLQAAEGVFQPDLYYAIVSRTVLLMRTNQAEACGNLAKEALDSLARFQEQYGTDKTFLRCQSRLYHNLSRSHASAGRHEKALEHVQKAIDLCPGPSLDTYNEAKDLPLFTFNLCGDLNALGRTQEAIVVGEQAVLQLRGLAQRHPAFKMDLSNALIKLSRCFETLKQAESALSKLREALTIRQELVDSQPALQPELALLWRLYSYQLNKVGCGPQALEAMEESIKLFRGISDPSSIQLEGLAASLSSLSSLLPFGDPKRRDALTESIRVYRNLQSSSPNQLHVLTELADLLLARCEQLTEHEYFDDDDDPGVMMKEAMDIYRTLSTKDPQFLPKLALSLFRLSTECVGSPAWGNWQTSLERLRESVDLYRELMAQNPEHKPAFLHSLFKLAHELDWHGQSAPAFKELAAYRNAESEAEVQHEGEALSAFECTGSNSESELCREGGLTASKRSTGSDSMPEAQYEGEDLSTPERLVCPDSGSSVPREALEVLATLHTPTWSPSERNIPRQLVLA